MKKFVKKNYLQKKSLKSEKFIGSNDYSYTKSFQTPFLKNLLTIFSYGLNLKEDKKKLSISFLNSFKFRIENKKYFFSFFYDMFFIFNRILNYVYKKNMRKFLKKFNILKIKFKTLLNEKKKKRKINFNNFLTRSRLDYQNVDAVVKEINLIFYRIRKLVKNFYSNISAKNRFLRSNSTKVVFLTQVIRAYKKLYSIWKIAFDLNLFDNLLNQTEKVLLMKFFWSRFPQERKKKRSYTFFSWKNLVRITKSGYNLKNNDINANLFFWHAFTRKKIRKNFWINRFQKFIQSYFFIKESDFFLRFNLYSSCYKKYINLLSSNIFLFFFKNFYFIKKNEVTFLLEKSNLKTKIDCKILGFLLEFLKKNIMQLNQFNFKSLLTLFFKKQKTNFSFLKQQVNSQEHIITFFSFFFSLSVLYLNKSLNLFLSFFVNNYFFFIFFIDNFIQKRSLNLVNENLLNYDFSFIQNENFSESTLSHKIENFFYQGKKVSEFVKNFIIKERQLKYKYKWIKRKI